MMKVILFASGAVTGAILNIVLSHYRLLPEGLDGRWIAAGFAIVGLIVGNYLDNKREVARIARELDQERIQYGPK